DPVANLAGEVSTGGRLNVKNAVDALMADCSVSACNAPYNVHDNQITDTTAAIVWSGFSTNYLVYIQEGSNPPVEIALTNQDTIFFDTLIPCTNYNVQVKGVC